MFIFQERFKYSLTGLNLESTGQAKPPESRELELDGYHDYTAADDSLAVDIWTNCQIEAKQ